MQAKQNRNSFTTSHQQASAQPSPGKQGCTTVNGYLGRQIPSLQTSPAPAFLPPALALQSIPGFRFPTCTLPSSPQDKLHCLWNTNRWWPSWEFHDWQM